MSSSSKNFLDWLTARQVLTREQVALVTRTCAEEQIAPEQAVNRLGLLSEADLMALYSDLYQLRFLKLEDVEIDPEATRQIPARIAHRYRMIPIRRSGNTLALVMADPLDGEALAAARSVTDFELIPFAGRIDAIEHAVYLHYGEQARAEDGDRGEQPAVSPAIRSRLLGDDDRVSHMAKSLPFNSEWTWDSLVVCSANEHAAHLLQHLPERTAQGSATVCLISGPAGSGKSHLLHAFAQATAARNPLGRLMLTTAGRFADHYYESARDGKLNLFRYLYRELDFLLVDDLDEVVGQDWAQQELLELLQTLLTKGKSACLMGREEFVTQPGLVPGLRGLLGHGDTAGIGEYPETARLAIAHAHCGQVELPAEIVRQIARRAGLDLRGMLGWLRPLVVLAAQQATGLSLDDARAVLATAEPHRSDELRVSAAIAPPSVGHGA